MRLLRPLVDEINGYYEEYQKLTDEELRAKTEEFRGRIREGLAEDEARIAELREKLKADLSLNEKDKLHDDLEQAEKERDELTADLLQEILPEAFAAVKEACRRLVGKKFDLLGNPAIWDMIPFDVQLI
ncbi:MAG TPA: preprotein translocase subunit SecA, partial [Bacteroidota bacterium]